MKRSLLCSRPMFCWCNHPHVVVLSWAYSLHKRKEVCGRGAGGVGLVITWDKGKSQDAVLHSTSHWKTDCGRPGWAHHTLGWSEQNYQLRHNFKIARLKWHMTCLHCREKVGLKSEQLGESMGPHFIQTCCNVDVSRAKPSKVRLVNRPLSWCSIILVLVFNPAGDVKGTRRPPGLWISAVCLFGSTMLFFHASACSVKTTGACL